MEYAQLISMRARAPGVEIRHPEACDPQCTVGNTILVRKYYGAAVLRPLTRNVVLKAVLYCDQAVFCNLDLREQNAEY